MNKLIFILIKQALIPALIELLQRKIFLNNIYTSGIPHACATQCHLSFITLSKTYRYDLFCKCARVLILLSGNIFYIRYRQQ